MFHKTAKMIPFGMFPPKGKIRRILRVCICVHSENISRQLYRYTCVYLLYDIMCVCVYTYIFVKADLSTREAFSVQFSCSVVSHSLRLHESQHAKPICPSPTLGVHSNSCPLSRWCHPAISSSVVPLFSCPPSLSASESFPMSQLFAWGGQSIGVSASASVLPMDTQDWFPLG